MSTAGLFHRVTELGRGTYGTVYKGTERATGRKVAFKRMNMTSEDENVPGTGIREICLLEELKHDNIVRLYQVLFDPPKITLIFELCDFDLKQYMENRTGGNGGGLDVDKEVRPILKQSFVALEYLHRHSVVHRDIKPQNIFLNVRPASYPLSRGMNSQQQWSQQFGACENGVGLSNGASTSPPGTQMLAPAPTTEGVDTHIIVKLGDFGLARVESIPVKKYSHEVVTLWYRSPDVIMGSALYSFPVDIWSMGVILFEVVTGIPLFKGRTDDEQLLAIMRLLGTPTETSWPSMLQYPETAEKLQKLPALIEKRGVGHPFHFSVPTDVELRESGVVPIVDTYGLLESIQFPFPLFDAYMTQSGFRAAVGEDGVDLLRQCLQYEPRHRITAADAVRHIFFRDVDVPSSALIDNLMVALDQTLSSEGL